MKDLFEMTAGTSTGSILAAGLAYPTPGDKSQPMYFGDELLEIYTTQGNRIFTKKTLSGVATTISFFIILGVVSGSGYFYGTRIYDNEEEYN